MPCKTKDILDCDVVGYIRRKRKKNEIKHRDMKAVNKKTNCCNLEAHPHKMPKRLESLESGS